MLRKTLRLNLSYSAIIHILRSSYDPKMRGHILKNNQKSKSVFIYQITRLVIMKMKMKVKNRSHGYGIYRPRSRHGHKYAPKQHLKLNS